MLKAIETKYNGTLFRSRLEARWALFFDELNIEWLYEVEGFELPSGRYLPDFVLTKKKAFVEVKRSWSSMGARDKYRLAAGWPRELARMCLPFSTYSKMFASVDLLNLMKFLQLRDHAHAQFEIRVYAEAMKKLAASIVPECIEAMSES